MVLLPRREKEGKMGKRKGRRDERGEKGRERKGSGGEAKPLIHIFGYAIAIAPTYGRC